MSSKQPAYLPLTRTHYEEAFLLYVDGELSPEAMDAVDSFTALHPDLREELDLLLETRLDAGQETLGDLGFLRSGAMQRNLHSDDLLSYIDNELPPARCAALELALAADPALKSELADLQAAKLPVAAIACPFKKELYRREEKRRPLFWLPRIAAAVVLLGAGTLLWQVNRDDKSTTTGGEGVTTAATKQPAAPSHAAGTTTPVAQPPAATTLVATTKTTTETPDRISTDKPAAAPQLASQQPKAPAKNRGAVAPQVQLPAPAQQQLAYEPDPRDRTQVVNGSAYTPGANETLAQTPVTSPAVAALNPGSNDAQPAATEAVYREEPRQGSVRGFLRKASRFLEKRTGIKTTNEDNQLVVGGVAINLK
ncbi:MAG: hypothetical protein EOO08_00975 [Chitinophagaceae bacterium]|nr:MAG: hypothetical protein EOO08_00975 [Chitinophagaceae bacterium]